MRRTVVVLLLLCALPARAAWTVDDHGACVEQWQSSDLLRGPTAIVNAPLVPFRSAAGGWQLAREDRTPGLERQIILPPMLTLGGGFMGVVETLLWLGGGLADTLTGGALFLAPEEATHLSVAAIRPSFLAEPRPTADPCGRPLAAR